MFVKNWSETIIAKKIKLGRADVPNYLLRLDKYENGDILSTMYCIMKQFLCLSFIYLDGEKAIRIHVDIIVISIGSLNDVEMVSQKLTTGYLST